MKKMILLLALVFTSCYFTASAQVQTQHFEAKNAFESFPALKQAEMKIAAPKTMPQFDAKQLLEEDLELEGLDVPFRFGKRF
jgi:Skp family chaperone for outer membrane proteins